MHEDSYEKIEDYVKHLEEHLHMMRKQGYDTYVPELFMKAILPQLRLARATEEKKDKERLVNALTEITSLIKEAPREPTIPTITYETP